MGKKVEIIAFYLPQYHPFPENDEWWGKGYTEWTTVGKAKPLFKGHNQPRVPTELGYYDLRLPIIREQQAQMARDAGVTAFCYWHYWFGNGKRLLADVFNEVLESGKPDFPFCLGWANHNWSAKNWNADGTTTNRLLIEQTYPGEEDMRMHFEFLLKAFRDERYVKIDGAPLFLIYDGETFPIEYLRNLKTWTREAGFPDLYMISKQDIFISRKQLLDMGYNAVYSEMATKWTQYTDDCLISKAKRVSQKYKDKFIAKLLHHPPFITEYRKYVKNVLQEPLNEETYIPMIIPQWDHTPRSGWNGTLFINATPDRFYHLAKEVLSAVSDKKYPVIFLKSWNEWGEGNMMEPDLTYSRGFIDALHNAVEEVEQESMKFYTNI